VEHNVYSVPSRLIGERVHVRLYADYIEVWYAQQKVDTIQRLRGRKNHRVNYRHVIHWLVRKPGAFANYRYRDDLFPTSRFRMALDVLERDDPQRGHKTYLKILELAATQNETRVDEALRVLIDAGRSMDFKTLEAMVREAGALPTPTHVAINKVDLARYDVLVSGFATAKEAVR
jgi:hypothetical protein